MIIIFLLIVKKQAYWACYDKNGCQKLLQAKDKNYQRCSLGCNKLASKVKDKEVCDGKDNDMDGLIDVIPALGSIKTDGNGYKFSQNVTATCNTEQNCGVYGLSCTNTSFCTKISDFQQGVMCVCKKGWQSCDADGCGTNILTNQNNCGSCGKICVSGSCNNGICI